MSRKRISLTESALTLEQAFNEFVASQMAKGIKEKTAQSYRSHYKALAKHLDNLQFPCGEQPVFCLRSR